MTDGNDLREPLRDLAADRPPTDPTQQLAGARRKIRARRGRWAGATATLAAAAVVAVVVVPDLDSAGDDNLTVAPPAPRVTPDPPPRAAERPADPTEPGIPDPPRPPRAVRSDFAAGQGSDFTRPFERSVFSRPGASQIELAFTSTRPRFRLQIYCATDRGNRGVAYVLSVGQRRMPEQHCPAVLDRDRLRPDETGVWRRWRVSGLEPGDPIVVDLQVLPAGEPDTADDRTRLGIGLW